MKTFIIYRLRLGIVVLLFPLLQSCGVKIQGVDLGRLVDIGEKVVTSNSISEDEEVSMGAQMTAVILGAAKLHPDQSLQNYVNRVGYQVARQSERPNLNWHFAVIDTPDLNAFAMPGGFVVISSGLLSNLYSESELAGVLAHEIAHVVEKHHVKEIELQNSVGLLTDIAVFSSEVYDANRGSSRQSVQNREIAAKLLDTTQELYTKGLSRDDEHQADKRALVLAARAGYDYYGLAAVLQTLEAIDPQDSHLQLLFATHPTPSERITQLSAVIEMLDSKAIRGNENQQRFLNAVSRT